MMVKGVSYPTQRLYYNDIVLKTMCSGQEQDREECVRAFVTLPTTQAGSTVGDQLLSVNSSSFSDNYVHFFIHIETATTNPSRTIAPAGSTFSRRALQLPFSSCSGVKENEFKGIVPLACVLILHLPTHHSQ